jgi:predicted dehydrogenase
MYSKLYGMKIFAVIWVCCFIMQMTSAYAQKSDKLPIRLAVAGVSHGHASFIFGRKLVGDFELVGVFDSNEMLAIAHSQRYGFSKKIIFSNLERMLDLVKPEAVVAFGSIYDHMAVVEACAPRGIHVMVEKPLATTMEQALKMQSLTKQHNIHLLTDYETSWYPSTVKSFQLVNDSNFVGQIRKVVIHDGHKGPKEIGCSKEFLEWLTDPVLNGGGALFDFGCYGANLMTYLMKGQTPLTVSAVTQQMKPDIYPKVDDEATIVVTYPTAQCIIQASWNWPFNRKDMEIYGVNGFVKALNNKQMVVRNADNKPETELTVTANDVSVYEDPFAYFADVIKGKIKLTSYDLYSLENNIMVVKILDAARESARTGKVVKLQ